MKRLLILTILLVALPFTVSWGQEEPEGSKSRYGWALDWESNLGFRTFSVFKLTERVSVIPSTRIFLNRNTYDNGLQTVTQFATDFSYTLFATEKVTFALLGGFGVDWTDMADEGSVTYLTESAGGYISIQAPFLMKVPLLAEILKDPHLWFAGKGRLQLTTTGTNWTDQVTLAVGLSRGV